MKKLPALIFCLNITLAVLAQQDPLYSSYMQNPVLINPAYAGTYNMFCATSITRLQWAGMEGAPVTSSISAHTSIYRNKLSLGAIVVKDIYGISNNTEAFGTFTYKINFSDIEENVLSFGMQAGMMNFKSNYEFSESFRIKDDADPNFAGVRTSATEPNLGAGLYYRNKKLFGGISAPKILNSKFAEGNNSTTQYRRHYFITGGYIFDLIDVQLKPSMLIRYVEGAPVSFDLNGSVLVKDFIWLGSSLRSSSALSLNSVVLMTQIQLNDNFRLGYALDVPVNKIIRTSYGSHEFMLNIDLKLLKSHDIGFRYF